MHAARETLLWQLGVAKSLLDVVTKGLSDEEALRAPGSPAWSVHRDPDGKWVADWSDVEPDPAPPTTSAWLLWHIGWWWADVTERAFGDGTVARDQAAWPGSVSAALDHITDCHARWANGVVAVSPEDLDSVDLGERCWPVRGQPFIRVVAWVNSELVKNAAEIGVTRRILGVGYGGSA